MPEFLHHGCDECPLAPGDLHERLFRGDWAMDQPTMCEHYDTDTGQCLGDEEMEVWACLHCHDSFRGPAEAHGHEDSCTDNLPLRRAVLLSPANPERRSCGTCRHSDLQGRRSADCPHRGADLRRDCEAWDVDDHLYQHLRRQGKECPPPQHWARLSGMAEPGGEVRS